MVHKPTWYIFYESREYAREKGDPCLGVVRADTKEEAERIAAKNGMGDGQSLWACTTKLLPFERVDL